VEVSEDGDALEHRLEGEAVDPGGTPGLQATMEIAVLCNDVGVEHGSDEPMEAALFGWPERSGLAERIRDRFPRIRTEPFNRETQMMATFHEDDDGGVLVAVKGAPEAVLEVCTHQRGPDGDRAMDDEDRRHLEALDDELAERGLRVLAMARKRVDSDDVEPYEGLTYVGYVGLLDPPRADVADVVERCRRAGIRVIMVTGDHPATALEIARSLGIGGDEPRAMRGSELPDIAGSQDEDRDRMLAASVFARVTPEQKLALIDLQQAAGEIVAMTGDGVNDAPALRSADIGVAMGDRGTQVAREAADMVLQDDAFESIVAAVEQGRVIFENIRRFVIYLLSGNVGEILAVAAAVTVGLPLPLLPLQILYLNMINDVFPALALGVGKGASGTMDVPPRDPQEPVLTRGGWGAIGGYGLLIAAVVLGVFLVALGPLGMDETTAVTVSFLTLSISRLVHVFNMRKAHSGLFRNEISENPFVWGAFAVSIALLLVAVYVPPLADVLGVTGPGVQEWLLIGAGSAVTLVAGQLWLTIRGLRS
jgi:Ca2+-transporting ATPase